MPASITGAVLAKTAGLAPEARALIDQVSVADGGCPTTFGERRGLHRCLAEALADEPGADPGLVARHWHLADCPDMAAAAAVLAARRAVSVRAYPEAAKNYALAIELAVWLPSAGPDLLEEAARAASWAGNSEQAAAWAADAVAQSGAAGAVERARRLERLRRYRWEMGDLKAAVETTAQAVVVLEGEPPSRLQARVLAALATWRMLLGELDAAQPLAVRAVAVARQAGADAERAHGRATLGLIRRAPRQGQAASAGWSVPQYLHLDAAAGRSVDRHAGQVLTGAGSPNTSCPRRAWTCL